MKCPFSIPFAPRHETKAVFLEKWSSFTDSVTETNTPSFLLRSVNHFVSQAQEIFYGKAETSLHDLFHT
jgi:hypothetical protein